MTDGYIFKKEFSHSTIKNLLYRVHPDRIEQYELYVVGPPTETFNFKTMWELYAHIENLLK